MQTLPILPSEVPIQGASFVNKPSFVSLFLSSQRSEKTQRGYRYALQCFADYTQSASIDEAVDRLLQMNGGSANALIDAYKVSMKDMSPATINLRLSTIREAVKTAKRYGMIDWSLEVENVQAEAYRDTRGCGLKGYISLLAQITGDDLDDRRNRAILQLLFNLGLRRSSVVSIDIEDLDFAQHRLCAKVKRKAEKVWMTVPDETQSTIETWLAVHPIKSGALFVNLDRTKRYNRLHDSAIQKIVNGLASKAGIRATPHGIRHAAATTALEAGMDVRYVQKFLGHANIATTMIYDDRRRDMAGEVANVLSRLPKTSV